MRFHSVDYITEMIKRSLRQYPQVEGIYFHDNDFMIDPIRVEQLCRRFIETGLAKRFSWAVQTRSDRLDPDIVQLMRRAGCIKMEIGVEAAAQKDLDSVRKGTTVGVNERALRLCRDAGISVHVYILTRTAKESLADLEMKLDWVKKNRPDTFSFHPLMRHPGSLLYNETGAHFFETQDWTRDSVRGFYAADVFSEVAPQERKHWTQSRFKPYSVRHHRHTRLRLTPVQKWPQMLWKAVVRRIRRRMVGNVPVAGIEGQREEA